MAWIELNATSPAPPDGMQNGHFRADTTHLGTATDPQPVSLYMPNAGGVAVKTANYTLTAADCGKLIVADSAAAIIFTLPAAIPFGQWQVRIANIGAGALSVAPGGALTLDGATSAVSASQFQSLSLATDGANYFSARGLVGAGLSSPLTTEGDIIYAGAGGAPTRLAAGTAGQILQTNGNAAAPSWVTAPAGGGSGLGISLFPGVQGVAPTLAGTGLTTPLNQSGTFSALNVAGAGIFVEDTTGASGDYIEGVLAAYPASPFTLTAVISVPGGNNFTMAGVVLAGGASGPFIFAGVNWRPAPLWGVMLYNRPTSFNAIPGSQAAFSAALLGIKVKDDGTNITAWFSVDGLAWTQQYKVAKSSSILASAGFNNLGFILNTGHAAISSLIAAWNVTTP